MRIPMDRGEAEALAKRLSADPSAASEGGYVVDLYDADPPATLELAIDGEGVDALAAVALRYDEESGGWYLADRIEDAGVVRALIEGYLRGDEAGEAPEAGGSDEA